MSLSVHNFLILFFFITCRHFSFAQNNDIKRTYHWYFGHNAGIDFSSGVPVADPNGMVDASEGNASMSDTSGNLLFYTDGDNVWDKTHNLMPNGTGLYGGGGTSSQSSLILPKPGSDSLYYIFTADAASGGCINNCVFSYSIVDMSLNSGRGDVTVKNTSLVKPVAEKITAVKHCNGKDIWVITHELYSDFFYVYLLTSAGVSPAPVISKIGLVHADERGEMKASPNGKYLACAIFYKGGSELFDFDNSTGIISNGVTLPYIMAEWGVSFSPDNTKLYISSPFDTSASILGSIHQYDLLAANIPASQTLITPSSPILFPLGLQLAPDGKIYVCNAYNLSADSLGVINNPNVLGTGCNYVPNAFYLGGKLFDSGLPNFLDAYFDTTSSIGGSMVSAGNDVSICAGGNATLNVSGGTVYTWSPSTGLNNPTISNPIASPVATTTYIVTGTISCGSAVDTVVVTVIPSIASISGNIALCTGTSTTLTASGGTNYSWSNGQTTSSITITPSVTTTYSIIVSIGICSDTASATVTVTSGATISQSANICFGSTYLLPGGTVVSAGGIYNDTLTDANGCDSIITTTLTVNPNPTANAFSNITITQGQSVTLTAEGGGYYIWSNGVNGSSITVTPPVTTVYCVTVTDANNCTDTACVTITIEEIDCSNTGKLYLPNAFSPNNDGENDKLQIYYGNMNCIFSFSISIFDRWGEIVFHSSDPLFEWDGSYNSVLTDKSEQVTQVLVYHMDVFLITGDQLTMKGNISLIK